MYTRHLSLNKALLHRPSERSGLGFVGQCRSVFMCRGKSSQRHLMAINNAENETGRRKGEGREGALNYYRNKETAWISKLMHYKINSALLSANFTFFFPTLFYCITHWSALHDRLSLAVSPPESRCCCFNWAGCEIFYTEFSYIHAALLTGKHCFWLNL